MARKDYIVGSGNVFEDLDTPGRPRRWRRRNSRAKLRN